MLGITPVNNKSQPSFGMDVTKSTVRFLKKAAPDLINEYPSQSTHSKNTYEIAKKAITKLIELGKRDDGLIGRIGNDGDNCFHHFNISVNNKKQKLPYFVYSDMQSSTFCSSTINDNSSPAEIFNAFVDYISTSEFITSSNKAIDKEAEYLRKLKPKDKIKNVVTEISEKADDFRGWLSDAFSLTMEIKRNGKSSIRPTILDMVGEKMPRHLDNNKEKQQVGSLRQLINQLLPEK